MGAERSGPQNQWVHIVLKVPKSAGAKDDVAKIYKFLHSLHPVLTCIYSVSRAVGQPRANRTLCM